MAAKARRRLGWRQVIGWLVFAGIPAVLTILMLQNNEHNESWQDAGSILQLYIYNVIGFGIFALIIWAVFLRRRRDPRQ